LNSTLENDINSEEEMNLYDYWKVLVKRKNMFISIFLVPLVIATIVSFSVPRYYLGEAEISYPASHVPPAPNIINLIGNIDDTKKVKIFTNNPDAVKSVLISISKTSNDKIKIIVDAKTSDVIPQAFKDILAYINNLPEIKGEIARIKEENNSKIKNLTEVKKENLIFLNQITDMIKKRKLFININPADLIRKDGDLSIEIANLQKAEVKSGTLSPLSITIQPSNLQIRKIIISTGALSLVAAIFVVFFLLDYIERIKARENK